MKLSRPSTTEQRKSSTPHYQTFPTPPPKSKGRPPSHSPPSSNDGGGHHDQNSTNHEHNESPLPKRQLLTLAFIALCEQTALNSISPYLPEMASSFPEVDPGQVGIYVGTIASAFALAQFATGFFWGWLSDRIGRKPVILTGTLLTAVGFVMFGFCKTLWQAVLVQAFIGMVNGNQGVVSTCLGEITDRSNQSKAFTYLPVIYGLGGITGPVVGGLLVSNAKNVDGLYTSAYPYLLPNLVSAFVLVLELIATMVYLEESLEEAQNLPPLGKRVGNLFSWVWQFASSTRPSYLRKYNPHRDHRDLSHVHGDAAVDDGEEDDSDTDTSSYGSMPALLPHQTTNLTQKEVLNRDTIALLATYLVFQLSNISYNNLYPIFSQAPPPTGRSLSPREIGLSLAFAGIVTIVFQVGLFGKLRDRMGNKITYRVGLGGLCLAFIMTPWVGYKDVQGEVGGVSSGKIWLWAELGIILLIKTIASVGGLTSFLLLITNSAPNHSVLGTLNGLAQTLSAAGRAIGPFLSGALFSAASHVEPKGEALAFGVFGGIAFAGLLGSFAIRGEKLEAEGWEEEERSDGNNDDDDDDEDDDTTRR